MNRVRMQRAEDLFKELLQITITDINYRYFSYEICYQ